MDLNKCFFCEDGKGALHQISSPDTIELIKEMAKESGDSDLMAKASGYELSTARIKYHLLCYTKLKNHCRSLEAKRNKVALDVKLLEARALSELFEYIKESMQEEKYLFKLEELHSLFINRLRCYGIETMKNKTRLKEKIL